MQHSAYRKSISTNIAKFGRLGALAFTVAFVPQAMAAGGGTILSDPGAWEGKHFHPKGKLPSKFTIELQDGVRKSLPFEDKRDFEEAQRGFIAAPDYKQIMAEAGNVAWDIGSYEWLLDGKDLDSIHPSLQRVATLNMAYGLYEVLPDKIYQVRGYDLANFTVIKGETGWIVFDPLTAKETAAAALKFVNEKLGERPVVAVVSSPSHAAPFGGVRGVVDEADVRSGKVQVIAPIGFMDHAVSENVYAGNAMTRRMFFQYGVLLPRSPFGHVDQAIGKNTAAGNLGLIAPNVIVDGDIKEMTVDGVKMVFQNTPGTEAPAEMNTYFPDMKAFWAAENITGTIHNIYTLRGALVRDALEWSKQINKAIYLFGQDAEVMFASHSWPRWGNDRIMEVMRAQRDAYANLNNGVLHLANQGVTINQMHNVYKVPESLQRQWSVRSYHGSVSHNSRAVVNRYLGYWDGNPTTLIPLSPEDSAPLYVEMMGGSDKIIAKGKELHDNGEYRLAMEILNKLVYAEPKNQEAKDLLADVFEQIGYQQEGTGVRNSFLAAAFELRSGIPQGASPKGSGPDMIKAMTTQLWLDYLAIRVDSTLADDMSFSINLFTPDNGEKFAVEMSNATLTSIEGFQRPNPDLTIIINRTDLEDVMAGKATFDAQIEAGKAKLEGNREVYEKLKTTLKQFEMGFEIMPGTGAADLTPDKNPFEADAPADTSGG
ncbi:MAG: alkyl sulfatase dimerization domain-containing protein [Anderseniella sp.]|nr:alkyl sulfatase dimerization domain-containing protein [Anderseniella sp.]